jgi:CelD/BcsL family acetyltransferase involved in cellulose biosynthesis
VYWHGAALQSAFELRPSTLLLAHVIEDACGRGCRWFDFNPSRGLTGVREFKRRFGAQPLYCPVVTHAGFRVEGAERLQKVVRRVRPLVERLPGGGSGVQR